MALDTLISFLGWATLTYSWLHVNLTFFGAFGQAIKNRINSIRQEPPQKSEDEDEV